MSDDGLRFLRGAAVLRDAFDRSFAAARPPDPPPSEDLLAIRVGSQPYAFRLSEIAGLFVDRKITRLPDRVPALLGIAGFRGAIVPVYDLQVLLGHNPVDAARWLATAAGTPIAFAFHAQEGPLRIARDAIVPHQPDGQPHRHVRESARMPDLVRPIVHLPSVLDAVRRHAREL